MSTLQFGGNAGRITAGINRSQVLEPQELQGPGDEKRALIEEKESLRWLENLLTSTTLLGQSERLVHVSDQESDIFDLFAVARNHKGEESEAILEIRYRSLWIQTARAKKKRYPEMKVTVIEAREQQTPADRDRIDWKLITDLAVNSRSQAVEKVQWYALR
jgi:hypothetical protein